MGLEVSTSPPPRSPAANLRAAVGASLAYVGLAVVVTWPLAARLSSAVVPDVGDPLLNTWILWWDAHAVPWTDAWWNAPAFHPARAVLGFSEHLLGITVLTTPLQWLGATPLSAYNVAVIASFACSALAAHFLVYTLTRSHAAAFVAGLAYGFNPHRLAALPHLQVLWSWGIPLMLAAMHRYLDTDRTRWLAAVAVAWLVQAGTSGYHLLFTPVLLALWLGWFVWPRDAKSVRRLAAIGAALLIGTLPLVPLLARYRATHDLYGLTRTLTEIRLFSADVTSLVVGARWLRIWPSFPGLARPEGELFPGVTVLVLTIAAAVVAWRAERVSASSEGGRARWRVLVVAVVIVSLLLAASVLVFGPWRLALAGVTVSARKWHKPLSVAIAGLVALGVSSRLARQVLARRSTFAFYCAATVVMWVFSFGPSPTFAGVDVFYAAPYSWLLELPGYEGLRVPARFAMLALACLAAAAGLAFWRLQRHCTPRHRAVFLAVVSLALLADTARTPLPISAPPEPPAPGLTGVKAAAVLEVPLAGTDAATFAMSRGEVHRLPVVNGYSGYEPGHYRLMRDAIAEREPGILAVAAAGRPLAVVVNDAAYLPYLESEGGVRVAAPGPTVFIVPGNSAPFSPAAGKPLAAASMTLSPAGWQGDGLAARRPLLCSPGPQSGRESIDIDLGRPAIVGGVRLSLGPDRTDGYPRRLDVELSRDGGRWETVWQGPTAALGLAGALKDPMRAPIDVDFPDVDARFVRLRQTAIADRPWCLAGAAVLGSSR